MTKGDDSAGLMQLECTLDDIIKQQRAISYTHGGLDSALEPPRPSQKRCRSDISHGGGRNSNSPPTGNCSGIGYVTKRRHLESRRRPRNHQYYDRGGGDSDDEALIPLPPPESADYGYSYPPPTPPSHHGGCSGNCQQIIYNISYGAGVVAPHPPHLQPQAAGYPSSFLSRASTAASYSTDQSGWTPSYVCEPPLPQPLYDTGLPKRYRPVSSAQRRPVTVTFIDDDETDEVQEIPVISLANSPEDGMCDTATPEFTVPKCSRRKNRTSTVQSRKFVHGECINLDDDDNDD